MRKQAEIEICEVPANTGEPRPPRLFRTIEAAKAQRLLAGAVGVGIPASVAFMTTSWVLQSGASLPEWVVKTVCFGLYVRSAMVSVARNDLKPLLVGLPAVFTLACVPMPILCRALIVVLALVASVAVGHFVYKGIAPMRACSGESLSMQSEGDHA